MTTNIASDIDTAPLTELMAAGYQPKPGDVLTHVRRGRVIVEPEPFTRTGLIRCRKEITSSWEDRDNPMAVLHFVPAALRAKSPQNFRRMTPMKPPPDHKRPAGDYPRPAPLPKGATPAPMNPKLAAALAAQAHRAAGMARAHQIAADAATVQARAAGAGRPIGLVAAVGLAVAAAPAAAALVRSPAADPRTEALMKAKDLLAEAARLQTDAAAAGRPITALQAITQVNAGVRARPR